MKKLILLAFVLIVNMCADEVREIISGDESIVIKSYKEMVCGDKSLSHCIYHFAKQCDNGKNYVACCIIGSLQDGQEQYSEAKKHHERVCEKANSKDIFKVEDIDGEVLEIPAIEAMKVSCNALGAYYHSGRHVKQDYKKALQYWEKACDLGNGYGCASAGDLYLVGAFIGDFGYNSASKAKELYNKACNLGLEFRCGYR